MKIGLPTLVMIISGAFAFQDIRSDVDVLNKDMEKQEAVRDDVTMIKGDVNYIKERIQDIKIEQKEIKQILNSINIKVK